MQLSVDLFNGLLLFAFKAFCILMCVQWLVEQSRGLSASVAHSLLASAVIAVVIFPLLALILPHFSLPLVPPSLSGWLQLPVVERVENQLSYRMVPLLILVIYFVVACWLMFYMIFGVLQVAAISRGATCATGPLQQQVAEFSLRLKLRSTPQVKVTDEVSSPQVWGVVRPLVLLPSSYQNWQADRLRRVLIHELAHVQRQDWLFKVTLHFIAAVVWFLPFVWRTVRRSAWYAELACDDWVVLVEGSRADYADDLLALSMDRDTASIGSVSLVNEPNMYSRIRALLDGSRERRAVTMMDYLKNGVVSLLLIVPLATVNAVVYPQSNSFADDRHFLRISSIATAAYGDTDDPAPIAEPGVFREHLMLLKDVPTPPPLPLEVIHLRVRQPLSTPQPVNPEAVSPVAITVQSRIDMTGVIPLVTVVPEYPRRALGHGIEGTVTVRFDVGVEGEVINPHIIAASPSRIFNRSVLEAVEEFRFRPQQLNGQTLITKDVTETFHFKLISRAQNYGAADHGTADNPHQPIQQFRPTPAQHMLNRKG